jgi:hypothetical protein
MCAWTTWTGSAGQTGSSALVAAASPDGASPPPGGCAASANGRSPQSPARSSTRPCRHGSPVKLSPGSNCPPMTSRTGPTFSLPAEPGTATCPGDRMHYRKRRATAGAVPGRPRTSRPRCRRAPAWPGHAPRTAAAPGQRRQTAFAAASRAVRRGPRSLSGGKNRSGSASRQAPVRCQSHSSRMGPGSRPGFGTGPPLAGGWAVPPTGDPPGKRGPRRSGAGRQVDVARRRELRPGRPVLDRISEAVAEPPGGSATGGSGPPMGASAQLNGVGRTVPEAGTVVGRSRAVADQDRFGPF